MKRGLTLILFFLVSLTMNAQEVVEEQRTLLTKKTATWCPLCGTWGWSFMKNIMSDNADKAVIIGAHYSGDLTTPAASELVRMFGGSGQPIFYADGTNLRVSSSNTGAKRTEVQELVDDNFNTAPVANTGMDIYDRGGDLDIEARVEFFQASNGTYKLAVWVVENDVVNNQAGVGPNAMHPYVFRAAVNGVTGEEIATGSISAGTTVEVDMSLTPNPNWDMDNLSFVAVIWKENGADHEFVNAFQEDDIQISTSVAGEISGLDFSIRPSILKSEAQIVFDLDRRREITVKVFDLIGSEVITYAPSQYNAGTHTVSITRDDLRGRGMYMVTLSSEGEFLTKRLLVE